MIRPWSSILAYYSEHTGQSSAIRAMALICQRVCDSPLALGLYAWTSMFDLCITQRDVNYPYNGPYLKISPLTDGRIEFRYLDTNIVSDQWHRIVIASEAVSQLMRFLEQMKWFTAELLHE
jgi:hypothetical protein